MNHIVNVFLGKGQKELAKNGTDYQLKYGENSPYFNCLVWQKEESGDVLISKVVNKKKIREKNDTFISDFSDWFDVGLEERERIGTGSERESQKRAFFSNLYNEIGD